MPTTIRDFEPADARQFLEVARDLQAYEVAIYDRMMPVSEIGDWYIAALQERCLKENGSIIVAETANEVVGFAAVFTRAEQKEEIDEIAFTFGYVSHIAVRPSARGLGIGKLLLDECERRVIAAGRNWLRIGVLASNPRARDIYERFGFHDHLVTMEKPLAGKISD